MLHREAVHSAALTDMVALTSAEQLSHLTHCLLHNYRYKRTLPYRTTVNGPAVFQCQPSDVQHPLKDRNAEKKKVSLFKKKKTLPKFHLTIPAYFA